MRARRVRPGRLALLAVGLAVPVVATPLTGRGVALVASGSAFEVGAAQSDITPPSLLSPAGQALDKAEFVGHCGLSESQIATLWPGTRLFAFEKPYVDLTGAGRYVPGDPYCDADGTHRYEAPYIAGGSGQNHWPVTSADTDPSLNTPATTPTGAALTDDPIGAQAVVFTEGGRRVAMVSVDSIGLFDSTMDQIRAAVHKADPSLAPADIFVSSTHDESAPDPIGLWGPDLSGEPAPVNGLNGDLPVGISSGVDEYYMHYLVSKVADAVVRADAALEPAQMKVATARMPANTQSCWSSYPFVDTELMPVMQALSTAPADAGRVIFTLANVGTHDESLAFSGVPAYTSMLSGDWTGRMRAWLEADYPGSVAMEMAGLVGSVETPALYPAGTQVLDVPGAFHDVAGNPVDGCSSVYPEPLSGGGPVAPQTDALNFVDQYGKAVADTTVAALASTAASVVTPSFVSAQSRSVCVQLENNLFAVAFAAGLFPDRPAYLNSSCTVGATTSATPALGGTSTQATLRLGVPAYLRSAVGVVTLGPIEVAYSPGEVFPFTEVGGPVDEAQMPFPTSCYLPSVSAPTNPAAGNYSCGKPLPMTPAISADMTTPYRFLAGLGQDMIGYLVPPGNFVGAQGEVLETPWSLYEDTANTGNDRFGYGHADDPESVGPYAGLAVTDVLESLLAADGTGTPVVPGLFVDAAGRLCDSPFPAAAAEDTGASAGSWVTGCRGFTGAVGVRVVDTKGVHDILLGTAAGDASGWATYLGGVDAGTAGTGYGYSVATRGVVVNGAPLLIDVMKGAQALG